MAIDYSQRPAGMSKREYAASILGGSKDDYDSSGNKKSTSSSSSKSSSSSYNPVTYKVSDFVDTKSIEKAYSSAKSTYTDQLTALKPRYEELYKQLQASQDLAAEKEAQLQGTEDTQQKTDLAKRGISTDTGNTYYNTEADKLQQQQNIRAKETDLDYAGKRLDVSNAESADERDLNTSIANLDLSKATTISSMLTDAKKTVATMNQAERTKAYESALAKSEKALATYKAAKAETTSKNDAYNSALSALVAKAYDTSNPAEYTREKIAKQLKAAYPSLSSQIDNDISKFFPDGWESQAGSGVGVKTSDDGETYLSY